MTKQSNSGKACWIAESLPRHGTKNEDAYTTIERDEEE